MYVISRTPSALTSRKGRAASPPNKPATRMYPCCSLIPAFMAPSTIIGAATVMVLRALLWPVVALRRLGLNLPEKLLQIAHPEIQSVLNQES